MRFILWASFEELLWQSHRQWKRNPSQAELNPQICRGLSVSSLQCTMCSLYSLSPFQPNKLRHFLCLDIPFIIYMSQVVRLERKHDFRGNPDFKTLKVQAPFTCTTKLIGVGCTGRPVKHVFGHLGPIWTLLDHFRQNLIFCSKSLWPRNTFLFWGKKSSFVWNDPKESKWAQNGHGIFFINIYG